MPVVSILNTKGGVGKTTISVNLSRCFKKSGKETLLVDSDIQMSSMNWHEQSNGDLLDIISLPRSTLDKDVSKFRKHYEWIIIDGVPRLNAMAISALNCSDVVLIPVQPSPYDVKAADAFVRIVKEKMQIGANLRVAFLINGAIVGTRIGNDVRNKLMQYELPIFKSITGHRVIYPESADNGTTVVDIKDPQNKANGEIHAIMHELIIFAENHEKWISLYQETNDGSFEIAI